MPAESQSTLLTFGTNAHRTTIVDIIDTILHTTNIDQFKPKDSLLKHEKELVTHKGCNELIPNLAANNPVKNGSTAAPAWPTPLINPMQPA